MTQIYLDAAGSYIPGFKYEHSYVGNPHSLHMWGNASKKVINQAEDVIRQKLSIKGGRFYWVGSGSEANRLAIEYFSSGGLVTSCIEHKSIIQHIRRYGIAADVTPEGCIDFNDATRKCNKYTDLVSIQLVNNETGVINIDPHMIRDMGAPHALYHSDLAQAFCKISLEGYDFDLLSISAHKVGGPKGLGCLWVHDKVKENIPYLGTPDPGAIMAFGNAVEEFPDYKTYLNLMADLSIAFYESLDVPYEANGLFPHKLPGILNLAFKDPYIDATELMMICSSKGVHFSTGAACNNQLGERSHVLMAMGLPLERIDSSIRISFHHHLTVEDVQLAAQIISETVKEIRENGS